MKISKENVLESKNLIDLAKLIINSPFINTNKAYDTLNSYIKKAEFESKYKDFINFFEKRGLGHDVVKKYIIKTFEEYNCIDLLNIILLSDGIITLNDLKNGNNLIDVFNNCVSNVSVSTNHLKNLNIKDEDINNIFKDLYFFGGKYGSVTSGKGEFLLRLILKDVNMQGVKDVDIKISNNRMEIKAPDGHPKGYYSPASTFDLCTKILEFIPEKLEGNYNDCLLGSKTLNKTIKKNNNEKIKIYEILKKYPDAIIKALIYQYTCQQGKGEIDVKINEEYFIKLFKDLIINVSSADQFRDMIGTIQMFLYKETVNFDSFIFINKSKDTGDFSYKYFDNDSFKVENIYNTFEFNNLSKSKNDNTVKIKKLKNGNNY